MTKKDEKKPEYYQDYLELEKLLKIQQLNSDKQGQHAHDKK